MASRSLGSLTIDLIAKIGGFVAGMTQAERVADRKGKDIAAKQKARALEVQRAWASIGSTIKGAFAGITLGTLVGAVRATIDGVDALNDFAEATGASVEAASALDDVARRTGTSLENVEGILVKFNQTLKDSKTGEGAAEVLKEIGLNAEELKRLDPAEALRQTAVALSKFADDGNKARAVQALFGKSIREAAPFLNDLAQQTQLVGTVTEKTAKEAEQFNKNIFELQANIVGVAREMSGPLVTSLNEMAARFKIAHKEGNLFWEVLKEIGSWTPAGRISEFISSGNGRGAAQRSAGTVPPEPRDALRQMEASLRPSIMTPSKDELERLKEIAKQQEQARKDAQRSAEQAASHAKNYLESLQAQLRGTQDLSVAETVLADIREGRLGRVSERQKQELLGVAQQIDAAKRLQDQLKAEADQEKEFHEERRKMAEEARRLFEETRTPLENYNAEIERLNRLYREGVIDVDIYIRAIAKTGEAFEQANEVAKKTGEELDDFAKNAAENIQRELGSGLYEIMQGNFKNIGDSFKQMLDRMVAEALAANIARKLFGSLVQGGEGEGLFGSLLGKLGGVLFGGARAAGGPVSPGQAYLVGEQGPELFSPSMSGQIIPSQSMAKSVVIHQSFAPGTDRRTVSQAAAETGMAVQRALTRQT